MLYRDVSRDYVVEAIHAWEEWLDRVGRRSHKARYAFALVEFVEERVGSPQPHVARLMPEAMRVAAAAVPRPLTSDEVHDVLCALYASWRYGLSMRNWALRNALMSKTD